MRDGPRTKKRRSRPLRFKGIFERKGSRMLWARFRDQRGKLRRVSLETESYDEAERHLKMLTGDVASGRFALEKKRPVTLREARADVYRYKLHPNQTKVRSWRRQRELIDKVSNFLGEERTLASLTARDLFDFQEHRRTPAPRRFGKVWRVRRASDRTIAMELSAFRAMLSWASSKYPGADAPNVFTGLSKEDRRLLFVEAAEVAHEFSDDEVRGLLEAAPKYLRDVLVVAMRTGMRHRSELLALDWIQVSLPWRSITLTAAQCKGKRGRQVHLDDEVVAVLQAMPHREGRVFRGSHGAPVQSIQGAWKRTLRRAGISGTPRLHDLRHLFGSNGIMGGMDVRTLQQELGHRDLKLVERYTHPSSPHKVEAVRRAGQALSERLRSTVKAQSPDSAESAHA